MDTSSDEDDATSGARRRPAANPTPAARIEAETMIEDMIRLEVTKRGGKTARPGAIALAIAVIRGDEHVRRLTYPSQRQLYGLDPHDYSFKRDWIDDKECGRIRWMINVYYAADAASRATLRFPNPSAARQRAEKKKRAPSHS